MRSSAKKSTVSVHLKVSDSDRAVIHSLPKCGTINQRRPEGAPLVFGGIAAIIESEKTNPLNVVFTAYFAKSSPVGIALLMLLIAGCATAPLNGNVDRIVIVKSAHTMTLMNNGEALKTYKVAIGSGDAGPKEQRGDHKTPEGDYVIDAKKDLTCCYLASHLSYPNANDVARAQATGVDPGDMIEIHGLSKKREWLGPFHRISDWTDGCIAVDDAQMLEMWPYVTVGTPVEIDP